MKRGLKDILHRWVVDCNCNISQWKEDWKLLSLQQHSELQCITQWKEDWKSTAVTPWFSELIVCSMKRGLKVSIVVNCVKKLWKSSMKRGLKVYRCWLQKLLYFVEAQWKEDWKFFCPLWQV